MIQRWSGDSAPHVCEVCVGVTLDCMWWCVGSNQSPTGWDLHKVWWHSGNPFALVYIYIHWFVVTFETRLCLGLRKTPNVAFKCQNSLMFECSAPCWQSSVFSDWCACRVSLHNWKTSVWHRSMFTYKEAFIQKRPFLIYKYFWNMNESSFTSGKLTAADGQTDQNIQTCT